MSALLARFKVLALKLCVVLLLVWAGGMLGLLWMSGTGETKEALVTGKRFIITLADGAVEGKPSEAQKAAQEEEAALVVPPPAADVADVSKVTQVQESSNPIMPASEDLLDKNGGVALPKVSDSGIKPWQYYAKSFRRQNEYPLIAIVIGGLGMSKESTDAALALDDRFSLSFSPYAASVASWAEASRLTGHEMLVDLPLQTMNYPNEDPGPFGIMVKHANAENSKNLLWALSRFQGYIGAMMPVNEIASTDPDTIGLIESEMADRGLILLRSREPQAQENDKDKKKKKPAVIAPSADIWIDEELTDMAIQARLATLEQMAQRSGYAIGYAHAYPITISQLKAWHEGLGARGVVLAPVSFISKLKYD